MAGPARDLWADRAGDQGRRQGHKAAERRAGGHDRQTRCPPRR